MLRHALAPSLAGLLFASGCRAPQPAAPAEPLAVAVRAVQVERAPFARVIRAAGTVAAKDAWSLSFPVGGLVARVTVQEGDRVRKGQVLAALDPTEVAAGVRQAREAHAKAERDRDRARVLREEGSIARMAVEDAETGAAVSAAALQAAEHALHHATLIAPDDGWIDRRLAEPGEVVAPGRPVLQVSGTGRGFVVRVSLTARDVLGLEPGDTARVTLDADPGRQRAARVGEIARSATPGTGTFAVELKILPEPGAPALLAGLTAKVEIARRPAPAAAVPLSALLDGDGPRGAVFALEGDRARRRSVEIAFLQDGRAIVAGGLEGVDRIVTEGAAQLSDGASVRVVE